MKTLLAIAAFLLVPLSLAACGDDDEDTGTPTSTPAATAATVTKTPVPRTVVPTSTPAPPTVTPTPFSENVCLPNPDPATPEVNNVTAPVPFDQVTSPVQITGQISAFEAVYQVTIYDAQGNEIVDQFAMSNEGQTLAPFSVNIPFTVAEAIPACIWVYVLSAEDGITPLNVVQIPVALLP